MKTGRIEILKVIVSFFVILTFFFTGCAIWQKSLLERILEKPELSVKLIEVKFCTGVTKKEIEKIKQDFHLKYMGKVRFSDDRYIMLILKIPRGSSVEGIIEKLKNRHQEVMSANKHQEY